MNREQVLQLSNLARRLDSSPRAILIAAAQAIEKGAFDAEETLRTIRRVGVRHSLSADECSNLLLTPVSSFARDTLRTALDALWQVPLEDGE